MSQPSGKDCLLTLYLDLLLQLNLSLEYVKKLKQQKKYTNCYGSFAYFSPETKRVDHPIHLN